MNIRNLIMLPLMSLAIASSPASAQSPAAAPQRSATTLSAAAGMSAASSMAGATASASLTHDISTRLTIEAAGGFLGGNMGSRASTLSAGMLIDLTGPGHAVPYVTVGGGLYRASFDMDNRNMFGGLAGMSQGMQLVPLPDGMGFGMMQGFSGSMWQGTWTGPTAVPAGMPQFYSMRLGTMMASRDGRLGMRRFTDPMMSLGGGVNIKVSDRLTLRPDVRSLLVFGGGDTYTVTVLSVGFGYRF